MQPTSQTTDSTFAYDLKDFTFERVLDENPNLHFLIVLGTLPAPAPSSESAGLESASTSNATRLPAILRLERAAFPTSLPDGLSDFVESTKLIEHTDIYSWMHGWLVHDRERPDVKINVIFPATEAHIRKYTKQEVLMVTETPKMYEEIVKPYIEAFDQSRTRWVRDILDGKSEADRILIDTDTFIILPDMKWDPCGPISSLYLLALVKDPSIQCLRDLRGSGREGGQGHVRMLEEIRERAWEVAKEKWGLERGSLRMYVHYQPSYYHFHVHIVHASQAGLMGMTVGQAHLLDDIISMLNISPNILAEMSFTYGLGSQHGLYKDMAAAQGGV